LLLFKKSHARRAFADEILFGPFGLFGTLSYTIVPYNSQLPIPLKVFDTNVMLSWMEPHHSLTLSKRAILEILHHLFVVDQEAKAVIGVDNEIDILLFWNLHIHIEKNNEVLPIAKIAIFWMAKLVPFWKGEGIEPENLFFEWRNLIIQKMYRSGRLHNGGFDDFCRGMRGDTIPYPYPNTKSEESEKISPIEPDGAANTQTISFC